MTRARLSVPKAQIEWLVDRLHVGVPDAEVRADIESRAVKAGATPALVRKCGDYAVKHHHANRAQYAYVMGGMR